MNSAYGSHYAKERPQSAGAATRREYKSAQMPPRPRDQWCQPSLPSSHAIGAFYHQAPAEAPVTARRDAPPPPQRIPPKPQNAPTPRPDSAHRPSRTGESTQRPDPAWGYTGHPAAYRFDTGDEAMPVKDRLVKRRGDAVAKRFSDSPDKKGLVAAAALPAPSENTGYSLAFPPRGLDQGVTDLEPHRAVGPMRRHGA